LQNRVEEELKGKAHDKAEEIKETAKEKKDEAGEWFGVR
jgi:hypothetical protein